MGLTARAAGSPVTRITTALTQGWGKFWTSCWCSLPKGGGLSIAGQPGEGGPEYARRTWNSSVCCPSLHQSHSAQPPPGCGPGLCSHTNGAQGGPFPSPPPRCQDGENACPSGCHSRAPRLQPPPPFSWAWVRSPQRQGRVKVPFSLHLAYLPPLCPGPSSGGPISGPSSQRVHPPLRRPQKDTLRSPRFDRPGAERQVSAGVTRAPRIFLSHKPGRKHPL